MARREDVADECGRLAWRGPRGDRRLVGRSAKPLLRGPRQPGGEEREEDHGRQGGEDGKEDAPSALANRSGDRAVRCERGEPCRAAARREGAIPPALEVERARGRRKRLVAATSRSSGASAVLASTPAIGTSTRTRPSSRAPATTAAEAASAPSSRFPRGDGRRARSQHRAKPPQPGAGHRGRCGRTHAAPAGSRRGEPPVRGPPRRAPRRPALRGPAQRRAARPRSYSDCWTLRERATATTAASSPAERRTVTRIRYRRATGAAYLRAGMTSPLTRVSSAAADAAHPSAGCGTREQSPTGRTPSAWKDLEEPRLQSPRALLAQLVEHLHGKEGVDGSSPSEGLSKVPANRQFVVVSPLNTRTHSGHICGTRDAPRRLAASSDTS